MELDYLEKNILKAITNSSVFEFKVVKYVYDKKKSFDKTIEVLKCAVERAIDIDTALTVVPCNHIIEKGFSEAYL